MVQGVAQGSKPAALEAGGGSGTLGTPIAGARAYSSSGVSEGTGGSSRVEQ